MRAHTPFLRSTLKYNLPKLALTAGIANLSLNVRRTHIQATGYTNTNKAGDIDNIVFENPASKLMVLMKTAKLIAVFKYVPV